MEKISGPSLQGILKSEYKSRSIKNPAYSLRAFARDLGVSPGFLSRLISGKATISEASAKRVLRRIGPQAEKLEWFDAVAEALYAKDTEKRKRAQHFIDMYENGVIRKIISAPNFFEWNWFHFAIRRMTHLKGFINDESWIAQRLGLPISKVKSAIKNLLFAGGLVVVDNRLTAPGNVVLSLNKEDRELRKKMGRELFHKIEKSVLKFDRERSYHANHYFTLNKDQVQSVIQLIKSFEDQVDDLTYRNQTHDELYYLNINFLSLLESPNNK